MNTKKVLDFPACALRALRDPAKAQATAGNSRNQLMSVFAP
jgi:hypothetical protein